MCVRLIATFGPGPNWVAGLVAFLATAGHAGCADEDALALDTDTGTSGTGSTGAPADGPEPLAPLERAPLTTQQTLVPRSAIADPVSLDPRDPQARETLLGQGAGTFDVAGGEPLIDVTFDGQPPPAPSMGARLVTRFVHLADSQLADDESPLRLVPLDTPSLAGAFRPQETQMCQVLNAAVRTINAVHLQTPVDFVLLGGDNADSAQQNEVSWFLGILEGAPAIDCDSGADDDPIPGENNDAKDPFAPVGLDVPWLWVSGNHDVLVQGIFPIADRSAAAVGPDPFAGGATRDWSMPGGPVFAGPVVADERRALLDSAALLSMVAASGDGHGITDAVLASGKATYVWDVPAGDLRFVVVDTAAATGADTGVVTDRDIEDVLRPALDQAQADGVRVIVTSHHASTHLADGSGLGGTVQPGAVEAADWQAFLAEYPNILMHLAGHSHEHRVDWIAPDSGGGYWEVVTSALVDWPQQMRLIEVHDQGNGLWTITAMGIDFQTDDDVVAARGRELALLDQTSGWGGGYEGELDDRNVRLWVPQ